MSRAEALRKVSCGIFREIYEEPHIKRNGARILMEKLKGPDLKSYWPNMVADVSQHGVRNVSCEIPLHVGLIENHISELMKAQRCLPVGIHNVYRENISEWRRKRGGAIKKGTCVYPRNNVANQFNFVR